MTIQHDAPGLPTTEHRCTYGHRGLTLRVPIITRSGVPVSLCRDCVVGILGANSDTLDVEEVSPAHRESLSAENAWLREALTRFVPTRYQVYLGHEDDRVGGMVYETDTYPDLCAIETAVPTIAIAAVVTAYVGDRWVNIYD
jgi:hypothetical protein